jgi:hypothetical protein
MISFFKSEEFFHKWSVDCLHRFLVMRSNCHGRPCRGGKRPGRLARATILLCAFSFCASLSALAMDRFAALSMLESGDNDSAIGPSGEISRYQVLPSTWQRYTKDKVVDPLNSTNSLSVVQTIMTERCAHFQQMNHRAPSDFEFYLLWNCPARVAHPSKLATDRAQRFANLCQRP